MHGLIEPFYEAARIGPQEVVARGDIYEDQPMYLPARHGLRLKKIDPTTEEILDLEIVGRTDDIFIHPPLKRFNLRDGEAFILATAKLHRPVVVLAAEGMDLLAGPDVARAARSLLCAPIYGGDQFSESMRKRVRAYEFPNLFYVPESKLPIFQEGFVRLDEIQAIRRDHLRRRRHARLSSDAMAALEEWLYYYLTGRIQTDSLIMLYRQEELAKL